MKKLWMGISLLVVAGCANLTDLSAQKEIPSGWMQKDAAIGDAAIQKKWWEQFNDPVLNTLIEKAVQQNYDLKIAETRIRAARAQLLSVQAGFLPDVNGNGSVKRSRGSKSTGQGVAVGGERNLYNASVDSTWEFNIFGISPAIEAADTTVQATVENKYGVLLSLLGEVTNNYVELRRLQQNLILTDATIQSYQTSLDLASIRQKAGLTSGLDTARAQAALQTASAARPQLATQANAALRRLEVLLGQNPGTLDETLSNAGAIPTSTSSIVLATPAAVIANRPDIRGAEQTLRARVATRRVATAQYFPSINLPASFGWQAQKSNDLGSSNALMWALSGGLKLPIFDFGRIRADINLADANAEEAFLNYQKTVTGALSDVETALSDYLASVNRAAQLAAAVEANQTAVTLSEERYKRGLSNQLDLLDAQRSLYAAQQSQIQNQADEAMRLVTLYKAMGGGWHGFATTKPVIPAAEAAAPVSAPSVSPAIVPEAPKVKTETMGNAPVMVIE